MVPDAAGVLVACATVMFAAHCWTFGSDINSFLQSLKLGKSEIDDDKKKFQERMEAAFWDASIQQYIMASACWAHLGAIAVPGLCLQCLWAGSSLDPFYIFMCMAAWGLHGIMAAGILRLSPGRLRFLSLCNFGLTAGFMQTDPSDPHIVALTAVQTASRFANATLFVDIKTNLPMQLIITILQVRGAWLHDPEKLYPSMLVQGCVTAIILAVSCSLEFSIRGRIAMLLDSESMVTGFRKMLRGVTDGEALLDGDFKISGKADCLKTLLMTRHDFSGQKFQQLLMQEEHERFRNFLNEPSLVDSAAPRCLRVSLTRGKVRVGVDLFHVNVPHLFGKAHHLVAFREDSDSRLQHELPENLGPSLPLDISPRRSARSVHSARSVSSCGSQATALLQMCNELQEMTLMVDANTALLDVEQAHLSFVRQGRDQNDSSMPSFRRLVQPTDWGSVRDQLVEFAQRQNQLPTAEREVLKTKMRLQDAKRCVRARKVEVSAFSPPGLNATGQPPLKLHIHLSRLKPMKLSPKHQNTLPGLFENSEESSLDSAKGAL